MVFKNLCILVLWMKVASALEGFTYKVEPDHMETPSVDHACIEKRYIASDLHVSLMSHDKGVICYLYYLALHLLCFRVILNLERTHTHIEQWNPILNLMPLVANLANTK